MEIKLRPSGASRWLACPASIILEDQAPVIKSHDKVAAYLGTATHELLERCIVNKCSPATFRGEEVTVFEEETMDFAYTTVVDQRMIDSVQMFLDYTVETMRDVACMVTSELHMVHSTIEGLQGTADYVRIYSDGVADLYDLKNGTSPVQARNRAGILNKQLLSYATLLVNQFPNITTIRAAIVSPNVKTKKKVREADISLIDITHHELDCIEVIQTVEEITPSNVKENSDMGSHCFFCRAKKFCPLQAEAEVLRDFG